MIYVEPEIQERIIQLYFSERRTIKSLSDEFGFSVNVVRRIIDNYKSSARESREKAEKLAALEELGHLREECEELRKENDFLKKAAAFFAKESK